MSIIFKEDNFAEDYENLDLNFKEFVNIEFEECSFKKCNFSNSKFKNSIFSGCSFYNCDLTLLGVINSKFSEVTFIDCKIIGVDWTKACWDSLTTKPMKFQTSVLNSSSFYGLNLEKLTIKECEAKDVDFREANLKEADFTFTDFTDATFFNTNLTNANFGYAKEFNININHNILNGAKFSRYEAIRLLISLGIKLVD